MATRKIVRIDEEKCDGCGLCVPACAEGAIQIVDGKARLMSDIYCDGLGACLGECPLDAIIIEEREAPDFDEAAVQKHLIQLRQTPAESPPMAPSLAAACPGSAMRQFDKQTCRHSTSKSTEPSQLTHWPIQLMLVPPAAPFLKGADILLCADCVPFTIPDFHSRYLAGRALLVACPKLDDLQYYFEKLKDILVQATPRQLTVVKMEVPCCNGIAQAIIQARDEVAPTIPIEVHTIGIRGGAQCERIAGSSAA